MSGTIYLVWARRGDYSDRTEYAVCWYSSKAAAEKRAAAMEAESNDWRRRCSDADNPWEVGEKAMKALGDPGWAYYDETEYRVIELEKGSNP